MAGSCGDAELPLSCAPVVISDFKFPHCLLIAQSLFEHGFYHKLLKFCRVSLARFAFRHKNYPICFSVYHTVQQMGCSSLRSAAFYPYDYLSAAFAVVAVSTLGVAGLGGGLIIVFVAVCIVAVGCLVIGFDCVLGVALGLFGIATLCAACCIVVHFFHLTFVFIICS